MKFLLFLFAISLIPVLSFSQSLKGRVIDSAGEPIPAVSVYIQEMKKGLVCNGEGEFQVKLSPATYHLQFRCLGYETFDKEIRIEEKDVELLITMNLRDLQLPEIQVSMGEDPAYAIMRKAIEKAPYYQSVIKESTFEAYTKGSGKLINIPKLLGSLGGEELLNYKDKLLLQESYSEIKFTSPDQFEQTVKAYSSTMPNSDDPKDAFGVGLISLYSSMLGNMVSPLNPKAFSYYHFRYEGYDEENGQIINKIKVIPKLKDSKLMGGYIYIADDEWNIRYAELDMKSAGVKSRSRLNYHPVVKDIYLVTTLEQNIEANIMGVEFVADFLSSIQYLDIQLNDSLIAVNEKIKKKKKKSLEIKEDDDYKVVVDTLSTERDSIYWGEIRSIVLNEEEIKSYARKDTLQAFQDSIKQSRLHPKFKLSDLVMGGRVGGDSAKVSFTYDGLLGAVPEYNFVDGFWLGQSFELNIRKNKNVGWKINPMVYWAYSREKLLWNTDVIFNYAPLRLGTLSISGGSLSKDFVADKGMLRIENTIYTSFFGKNNARLYQKDYVKIGNEIDIANGLNLRMEFELADRDMLRNHTTYSFFGSKNDAKPNIPSFAKKLNSEYGSLTQYTVDLKYTPEYYYRIEDGKKSYVRSRFPTFQLLFHHGISTGSHDDSRFNNLELSIYQKVKLGLFDRLNYSVTAGKFFNHNAFNYIDYKHFNSGDQLISGKYFESSYSLLDYYTYSTNKEWLQAFVTYNTDYLLLKRLPFLQGKFFTESLHGKFLHTPDKKYYSEWGYSLGLPSDFGDIGGAVGIFVSFDSFDYNSWGVRISLPLLQLVGKVK